MLQRRQQCEAIRAKATPALKTYCLWTTLVEVARIADVPVATRTLT